MQIKKSKAHVQKEKEIKLAPESGVVEEKKKAMIKQNYQQRLTFEHLLYTYC